MARARLWKVHACCVVLLWLTVTIGEVEGAVGGARSDDAEEERASQEVDGRTEVGAEARFDGERADGEDLAASVGEADVDLDGYDAADGSGEAGVDLDGYDAADGDLEGSGEADVDLDGYDAADGDLDESGEADVDLDGGDTADGDLEESGEADVELDGGDTADGDRYLTASEILREKGWDVHDDGELDLVEYDAEDAYLGDLIEPDGYDEYADASVEYDYRGDYLGDDGVQGEYGEYADAWEDYDAEDDYLGDDGEQDEYGEYADAWEEYDAEDDYFDDDGEQDEYGEYTDADADADAEDSPTDAGALADRATSEPASESDDELDGDSSTASRDGPAADADGVEDGPAVARGKMGMQTLKAEPLLSVAGHGSGKRRVLKLLVRLPKDVASEPIRAADVLVKFDHRLEERFKLLPGGLVQVVVDDAILSDRDTWMGCIITIVVRGSPVGQVRLAEVSVPPRVLGFSVAGRGGTGSGAMGDGRIEEEIEYEYIGASAIDDDDEGREGVSSGGDRADWGVGSSGREARADEARRADERFREGLNLLMGDDDILEAVRSFESAADAGHSGAIVTLGSLYLSGYGTKVRRNETAGVEFLRRGASLGNVDAHSMLGFLYASGWSSEVAVDQGRAVLHWTIAARGGSAHAQMAMGYRYFYGIDVESNCDKASFAYLRAVRQLVSMVNSQELKLPFFDEVRLDDVPDMRRKGELVERVQYSKHSAERGDVEALRVMGQLHLFGARDVEQDLNRARELFGRAAEAGDARAHAYLGFMHYKGIGVKRNNETALKHFKVAAEREDESGLHGVGIAYRFGAGVEQSYEKAVEYFEKSARKGHAEALYSLGTMYLEGLGVPRSTEMALQYFNNAANKNQLHAMYQVGLMTRGNFTGVRKDCVLACSQLKRAAETWMGALFTSEAFDSYEDGDYASALYRYLQAAELGMQLAQFNAAYMLQKRRGTAGRFAGAEDDYELELYRRSAQQGHVDSVLKVGDILYEKRMDYEGAASVYQVAQEMRSAEATFNLGVMHVFGRGRPADFHLAKRYFDLARSDQKGAWLPTVIALQGLNVYWRWKPQIDQVIRWVSYLMGELSGGPPGEGHRMVSLPPDSGVQSVSPGPEDDGGPMRAMEYTDLALLCVLLTALLLVAVARRRLLAEARVPQAVRVDLGPAAPGLDRPGDEPPEARAVGEPGPF